MITLHTPTLPAIIGARLLPFGHSFGVVVCFESRLASCRLLSDYIAVWVAEGFRAGDIAKNPYRYCNEHIKFSMRQELRIQWTYSIGGATNDYA